MNNYQRQSNIKLLDCTLRDGGYYTNWLFDEKLVESYFNACNSDLINICEIGLRQKPNLKRFLGPCAFSKESFLNSLSIPSNLDISVLVNASDILDIKNNSIKTISQLFPLKAKDSKVDIVRIASTVKDLKRLPEITKFLSENGYLISINLMKCHILDRDEIKKIKKIISNLDIDLIYIADSLGCCLPEDIEFIVKELKSQFNFEIGIHAHDNKGLALANTLAAMKSGATYLDITMLGIGRGAGNTKTEELISLINKTNKIEDYESIARFVEEFMRPLKNEKSWGSSIYYNISSSLKLHPTFIQEMTAASKFKSYEILDFIKTLSSSQKDIFSESIYEDITNPYKDIKHNQWSPKDLLKNKEVLLVGSGPSLNLHKSAILRYINEFNPYVISLNFNKVIKSNFINAFISSHLVSLLPYLSEINNNNKPIIIPSLKIFNNEDIKNKENIYQYGLQVNKSKFEIRNFYCSLPSSIVFPYALATCIAGEVKKITLCGVDGFEQSDKRHLEHKEISTLFIEQNKDIIIDSLLPCNLGFKVNSVYNYV